jgi:hypothetical protein
LERGRVIPIEYRDPTVTEKRSTGAVVEIFRALQNAGKGEWPHMWAPHPGIRLTGSFHIENSAEIEDPRRGLYVRGELI